MSHPVGIALAQVTGEPFAAEANRALSVDVARVAFERGANVVVLPELIVQGYVADREGLEPVAEPADGPTLDAWRDVAAQADGIVVGGFCERANGVLYNTAIVVGPDGLLLHYRKAHLFSEEKLVFEPGDLGFPVVETRFGRIGVCVCYDLRFVEVVRLMALRGAEIVCVPTAWLTGFDRVKWDAEGLAPQAHGAILQANLNQVFIACASQAGDRFGLEFLGSSVLVDPFGHRVLGPLPGEQDEVAVANVDLDDAERAQTRGPLITPRADRRTDIYGIWDGSTAL